MQKEKHHMRKKKKTTQQKDFVPANDNRPRPPMWLAAWMSKGEQDAGCALSLLRFITLPSPSSCATTL
jgi:hypothetical protein